MSHALGGPAPCSTATSNFKPSNVLVGDDGAIEVADFGLATMPRELRADADDDTKGKG